MQATKTGGEKETPGQKKAKKLKKIQRRRKLSDLSKTVSPYLDKTLSLRPLSS
ncbi:hypothetical protein [Bacteroides pyogenes]|uniref:hypothetical protein n=1 Tax=Bacteroides pyogenes TaxID=310300 RepID=UPI000420B2DB|nr:hypothetical protein [Bacteroides pyogenes]MBB3895392.1 hypothetical protein [Bacteroides pyogenes]